MASRVASRLHRLRVGGVPEHFNAPWHSAASKGAFTAAGLQIDWVDFPGGTGAMNKALRQGEIDVALAGGTATLFCYGYTGEYTDPQPQSQPQPQPQP